MKIRIICGVVLFLSVLSCFGLVTVGQLQTLLLPGTSGWLCTKPIRGLEFCAEPKNFSVKRGEDIVLNLVVRNVGSEEAEILGLSGPSSRYKLSLVDENGTVLLTKMETKIKYHLLTQEEEEKVNSPRFPSRRSSVLKPDTSFSDSIDLSKLYDFSNVGTYYLYISRKTITPDGKVTDGELKLDRIKIEVK